MAKRRPAVSKFAGEQSQAAVEFVPGGLASDPVVAAPVSATLSVSPKRYADTGV